MEFRNYKCEFVARSKQDARYEKREHSLWLEVSTTAKTSFRDSLASRDRTEGIWP